MTSLEHGEISVFPRLRNINTQFSYDVLLDKKIPIEAFIIHEIKFPQHMLLYGSLNIINELII